MENVVISRRTRLSVEDDIQETNLPFMAVETISVATNNFCDSNKIGMGGFGKVYKVGIMKLIDGIGIILRV